MSHPLPFALWGLCCFSELRPSHKCSLIHTASHGREAREIQDRPCKWAGTPGAVLVAVSNFPVSRPNLEGTNTGLDPVNHKEPAMCSSRRRTYPLRPGELPPELGPQHVEAMMAPGWLNASRRLALGTLAHDGHDLAQAHRCACQRPALDQLIQHAEAHLRHQQMELSLANRALCRLRLVRMAVVGVAHA